MNYLRKTYPQAEEAYMTVRTMNDSRVVEAWLREGPDRRRWVIGMWLCWGLAFMTK